jgi:hypothetical protein
MRGWSLGLAILAIGGPAIAQNSDWLTDAATSCKVWARKAANIDAVKWSGQCVDGLANGRGKIEFLGGGKPVWSGEAGFLAGKREGASKLVNAEGLSSEDEYRAGERHGWTVQKNPSGEQFESEYRNGSLTGRGAYQYPDGARIEGEMSNGFFNGQGTFTAPDGRIYVGGWRNSLPHGQGALTGKLANGTVGTVSGEWRNGC